MIDIKAVAVLQQSYETTKQMKDPYLPSGVAASYNLLEPLSSDPAFEGPIPQLTASRLARIPLDQENWNRNRSLRKISTRTFRAVPVISSRVHYTKSKNNSGRVSLVASLDVEAAPFSNEDLEIRSVQMSLSEGVSLDLVNPYLTEKRLHRPRDITVYLFRLTLNSSALEILASSLAQTLDIAIDATVCVSTECLPQIRMRWKTGVDFSAALNPVFGVPGQSMQRPRRPVSLPVPPVILNTSAAHAPGRDSEERPSSPDVPPKSRQRAVSISDLGVTVTFTAPDEVFVGKPFKWKILVYNGSRRPRRLALTAIPRRRRDFRGHFSRPSASSSSGAMKYGDGGVADVVMDENLLYATTKSASIVGETQWQVVCLTTEVRIGLLNSDACSDFEMEFLPLSRGSLQLEAVRVTDLASGDVVDVRDLPDIVSTKEPTD